MKSMLTPENRQQLEAFYKAAKDKNIANRINALLLLDDGYTYEEVALILRLDDETIRRYERSFVTQGMSEYVKNKYKGGFCKLSEDECKELKELLAENTLETTHHVIHFVKDTFGVDFSPSGMTYLLKRLGFVYKKKVRVPGSSDVAVQFEFIEYLEEIRKTMKPVDKIYYVDGVHPQYNSVPAFGWILKGKEKKIPSNTGRTRINLNGAMDPDTLEVIICEDKSLNSDSTIKLFKLIEEKNKKAGKIVLIVDNARYYYCSEVQGYLETSKKIKLVYLPSYCPNLNLIERLWKFMRKKVMYNQCYKTLKDFKSALGDFFLTLPEKYDELRSIISDNFQIITQ